MSAATDRRDTIDAPAPGAGLRGLLRRAMRERDLSLRVACPGTVVEYTPATQTATVTLGFLRVQSTDTPAGEVEVPLPPELVRARVAVVQGATHSDQIPIAPGDTGLLLFADRALDQWYLQGGAPVDPVDGRAHDQADAVFFPGLAPDARRATPALNPLARTIEAPVINLGAAAVGGPGVAPAAPPGAALRGGQVANAAFAAATALTAAISSSPAPLNPATVLIRAEANTVAIQALLVALQAAISSKVAVE